MTIKKLSELSANDLKKSVQIEFIYGVIGGLLVGIQFSISSRENTVSLQISPDGSFIINTTLPSDKDIIVYE